MSARPSYSDLIARLAALDICTESDGRKIVDFLRSDSTVRSAHSGRSAAHARLCVTKALLACAPRCEELLQNLDERTPLYHPSYAHVVAIPLRLLDTTHSRVPRPVDADRNTEMYCGNPHKRGHMYKVSVTVRTYDACVLEVGHVVPGSRSDVSLFPASVTKPYLCDMGYTGAAFNAVVGYKKPPRGELSESLKMYNSALARWRGVDECVHGRLKKMFKRLNFWRGRDDGSVLRAAWLFAACLHNVYIARCPLVRPGRKWSWLLTGVLESSDPWVGGVPVMLLISVPRPCLAVR